MPKLLYFLPCERVIVSQESTISFINVFEKLILNVPSSAIETLSEDATISLIWYAVSSFNWQPEDEGRKYEQRAYLVQPNGRIPTDVTSPLAYEESKDNARVVVRVNGFPFFPAGKYRLCLAIREIGSADGWHEVAEHPLIVEYKPDETPSEFK